MTRHSVSIIRKRHCSTQDIRTKSPKRSEALDGIDEVSANDSIVSIVCMSGIIAAGCRGEEQYIL